jgi:LytS/YehU family sensor histidine kinase
MLRFVAMIAKQIKYWGEFMSIQVAIFVSVILMGLSSLITYFIGKRVSSRLIKYIPAIATGVGMSFFYIKLNFIPYKSHPYEAINDIVAIILLGIIFTISLLSSIFIEIVTKRKRNFH